MTMFHPSRVPPPPSTAGPVVTVTGWDGAVLATFTRRLQTDGDVPLTVVAVDGDVDQDTAPLLQASLVDTLNGAPRVCCDIAGARFFGAAGISTVLAAHRHATGLSRDFFLRGAHGLAGRVLRLADVTSVVRVEG
jgi:anti-anti-sigma factor